MTDTAFEMPDGLPSGVEDLMKILRPEDPAERSLRLLDLTVSTVTRATKLLRAARHEHAAKGDDEQMVDLSLSAAHDATARALAELMTATSELERVFGLSCTAHGEKEGDQ